MSCVKGWIVSMLRTSQISGGQLAALLLVSRLSVAMTYSATRHQLSNGLDFVLSIVLQSVLLLLLFLPLWWFSRRTGGAGTLDYGYLLFGRGGAVLAVMYALICLYVQGVELIRFRYFVATALSPDMPVVILCIVLVLAAYSAALYGIESLGRAAAIAAVLIAAVIAFIAFALMPEMDAAYFPPFLYDGFSPVIAGTLEETPRTVEIAVLGLLLPYCQKKAGRGVVWWCVLLAVVMTVIQLTVVGVLGDFGGMVMFSYYTAITAAQTSIVQRLDILAVTIWIAALFLKLALFGLLFMDCLKRLFRRNRSLSETNKKRIYFVVGAALALLPVILFGGTAMQEERSLIWSISSVAIGAAAVLVPLILLLADYCRRRNEARKEHAE